MSELRGKTIGSCPDGGEESLPLAGGSHHSPGNSSTRECRPSPARSSGFSRGATVSGYSREVSQLLKADGELTLI